MYLKRIILSIYDTCLLIQSAVLQGNACALSEEVT